MCNFLLAATTTREYPAVRARYSYDDIMVKLDKSGQAPAAGTAIENPGLTCYSVQDEIDLVSRIMNAVTLVLFFGHIIDRGWADYNKYDNRPGV